MSKSLSGVIFDLDGTLAETHPMAVQLIGEAIARQSGSPLAPEDVVSMFGPSEKGIFRKALGPGWAGAWEFYISEYVERHQMCPEPFDGIRDVLEILRNAGCRLGLVTGKTAETGRLSLDVLGLSEFFEDVRGGSMTGVNKASEIRSIVEGWGLTPQAVVYIGDTATDVKEAKLAGVGSVAACWSEFADHDGCREFGAGAVLSSVPDLSAWVQSRLSAPDS